MAFYNLRSYIDVNITLKISCMIAVSLEGVPMPQWLSQQELTLKP